MSTNQSQSCCESDAPLVHAMFTIHHLMMRVGDRLTAPHGLTGSRWMLLCALDRRGDSATVSDLADEQMMSVQAISRMLVAMVDEGLVTKCNRVGCGRTAFVSLTEKGRDAVAVLSRLGDGFNERFMQGFDTSETAELKDKLGRLIQNLRAYEEDLIAARGAPVPACDEECV